MDDERNPWGDGMTMDDRNYCERRAEVELLAAQGAVHPAAVRAHYLMAEAYLARMSGGDARFWTGRLAPARILAPA